MHCHIATSMVDMPHQGSEVHEARSAILRPVDVCVDSLDRFLQAKVAVPVCQPARCHCGALQHDGNDEDGDKNYTIPTTTFQTT